MPRIVCGKNAREFFVTLLLRETSIVFLKDLACGTVAVVIERFGVVNGRFGGFLSFLLVAGQ